MAIRQPLKSVTSLSAVANPTVEYEKASDSIRSNREFDSNEIDESDSHS
jgi:hypothetical protein